MAASALRLVSANSAFQPKPAGIVAWGGTQSRVTVQFPVSSWEADVMDRLNLLCALETGWDGYQGLPVNFETANFAVEMLRRICRPDSEAPQIVPGGNGDLQLEWHRPNCSIELHVKAPFRVHAWRSVDGIEDETEVTNDFTAVANWLVAIPEQGVAAVAAAY